MIKDMVIKYQKQDDSYVLILSDRRGHLDEIYHLLKDVRLVIMLVE